MKKTLSALIMAVCLTITAFAGNNGLNYDMPEFKFDNAFFVDAADFNYTAIREFEIEYKADKNNAFLIFGNDPKTFAWVELGQLDLKGFSDSKELKKTAVNCSDFRYFAVVPLQATDYNYRAKVDDGELEITVINKNASFNDDLKPLFNLENGYSFNIDPYDVDHEIIFINRSERTKLTIETYYFDPVDYKWIKSPVKAYLGAAGTNDDKFKFKVSKKFELDDIDYLALIMNHSTGFDFELANKGDNLVITIISK
ncbi:MAG: hypothetical protein MJ215_03995 [Spirochaetia bacterium]|nr:hypothetical protein [Spirochaetia bacterium]